MQLYDIPGWSEFLISFALYGLLLIVGYAVFDWLSRKPFACLFVSALCVCSCLVVPYGEIPTHLALLIGGRNFSYFPIVQYMPYFLCGMLYAQGDRHTRRMLLVVGLSPRWAALRIGISSASRAASRRSGAGFCFLLPLWAL